MPSTLLRPGRKVARFDEERQRVAQQLDEARYGRGHLFLPVGQVAPNPRNPRKSFDQNAINALAQSIREWDQLQPIIVRRVGEPASPEDVAYEIVAGERRWRAVKAANRERIWAVEKAVSDSDAFKIALIENLQRVDLSHQEKVAALDQLAEFVEAVGLRPTARELKVSASWLCEQIKLREDPVIFPALEAGHVNFAQAAELRRAPARTRRTLLDRALRDRPAALTIRQWVQDVRRQDQGARATVDATLATASGGVRPADAGVDRIARLREELRGLVGPFSEREQESMRELAVLCQALLASTGEPARTATLLN